MSKTAPWRQTALYAMAVMFVMLLIMRTPAIIALRFADPDDVLRMVQLRDLLSGQDWFDVTQYRFDKPSGGLAMHWSRLVDVPLVLVTALLWPIMGMENATVGAAIIVPLITLGCIIYLTAKLARRLIGSEAVLPALVALGMSIPLLGQIMPLRVDHHGWQIVMALTALCGATSKDAQRGAVVAGLALSAWMAISIEGLPVTIAFLGVFAMRWLRKQSDSAWFVLSMVTLAGTSFALFLATRGFNSANACDMISPVQLAVFGTGALGAVALSKFDPKPAIVRMAGLAAIAASCAGVMLSIAPLCAGGGFAGMDPLVEGFWYRGVLEGQPLWANPISDALKAAIPPLFGLVGSWMLSRRALGKVERDCWIDYMLLLSASFLVTVFVIRAGSVAGAFAAVPAGWAGYQMITALGGLNPKSQRKLVMGSAVFAGVLLVFGLIRPTHQQAIAASAPSQINACDVTKTAPLLNRLPTGEIFAPLDVGPQLLLDTRHSIVASGYHRGQTSMRVVISTFLGSAADARSTIQGRKTAYLALCADAGEIARYRGFSPQGFAARLADGESFDWLEPVPTGTNLRLWRVKPPVTQP